MDDFTTEKAPIATEFVVAKRNNQLENGYNWPIVVHTFLGNTVVFPIDSTMPEVVFYDNADFTHPQLIVIQGIWNGENFVASIGAQKTITVALLDDNLYFWQNAKDNIPFQTANAWTMPSTWDQSQIENWAETQFPGMELQPYTP